MLHLKEVLGPEQLAMADRILEDADFVAGTMLSGDKRLKDNLQASGRNDVLKKMNRLVQERLKLQPQFNSYALPFRMAFNINRYEVGMHYDAHNDAGVMEGQGYVMRTDLSMTLFLTAPDDYDGGELIMETPYGDVPVKLPRGDAIVYPSNMLHRVEPITRGARTGAFSWIQSRIRDEQQRLMVYRLDMLRRDLERDGVDLAYVKVVDNTYNNLVRMWSEV